MRKVALGFALCCAAVMPAQAIVINEIMYNPPGTEEEKYEWLELYNDYAVPLDIGGWSFSNGITYTFPDRTIMQGKSYLVICADIASMQALYGISKSALRGPFEGRLDNGGERIALADRNGAVMAHVRYRDREPWPAGADGTGHSLALINPDLENDESENWAVSPQHLGSPGEANGFETKTIVMVTVLLDVDEQWKYFKGTEPPSDPADAWNEPDFNDGSWLSGQTGIGYGDNDDATVLDDMQNNYLSVFCRKKFEVPDVSSLDTVVLTVDYDDGFIAYLNGDEVGRKNMGEEGQVFLFDDVATGTVGDLPETAEISIPKALLHEGQNTLAIQIHNASLGSTDLSMIPSMVSRKVKTTGGVTPIPVVVNEVLANSTGDTFVELFNNSDSEVDIGLTYLSDDRDNLTKYLIPQETSLQAWGYIAFTETEMGFQLPASNGSVYFTSSDGERVIDAYAYDTSVPDMSRGRYPDGDRKWYTMHAPTAENENEISVETSIVINEIMYHPYENDNNLEYIELYNGGGEPVDMSGWSFSKGVDFVFPVGTILGPDEYLVVAKNPEKIAQKYEITNVIGNYVGNLDNEGEKIELVDIWGNAVDGVRYAGGGRWPIWAAGWGSSLELIDPRQDNSAPSAWAASDQRNRAEWTRVLYTGQFSGGESEFHFFLMHRGECLVDEISMKRGGTEYIANGSFESGTSGWKIEGTHIQSRIETAEAHSGSRCLRIVATGRGDTGANRIECDTTSGLSSGSYTISFWVKRQRGINLIYTRTHNQGLPRATRFPMPDPRGTPGERNSVYSSNIGPVISEVRQNPIVPKSTDPVKVTARISDSDGVASVLLYYKGDSDGSYSNVEMYDDGAHGDGRAGDGLYAGQIPARGSTTLMRFYIVAQDTLSASLRFPAANSKYCLYQIENSHPSTNLPIYRILLTREVDQRLRTCNRLSNELEDCTFVLNDSEIFYNCGLRTRGSGWTRQNHPADQYRIRFPADQPLRGVWREINLDWHGDGTKQHDRMAHHLIRKLGAPNSYQRYVHVRFNSSFRALAEEVQKVDGDYVRFYWPDDAAGTLFKVDDHFEYNDSMGHNHWDAYLKWEGSNKEEYRWNWKLRTNEKEDDYSEFLDFVYFMAPTTTSNEVFDAQAEDVLDVDQWMKVLAVRFLIDDWDTLGYNRGKNAYIYKPYHKGDGTPEDPPRYGRWLLLPWDSDLTFSNANAPIVSSQFPSIKRMLERPQFARRYYSYYLELINGPFSREEIDPVLDRIYNALSGESGRPSGPDGIKSFVSSRISVIRSKIPSQANFAITTNSGKDFEVDAEYVTLEGTAPFTARTMTVSVNDGPAQVFEPAWLDTKRWQATFQLVAAENRMRVTGLGRDDNVVGVATITITWPPNSTEDSDGDGLFDREEAEVYHTDYLNPDTDGDGLTDGDEVHTHLTDPTKADTDGDTLPDGWEINNSLDPNVGNGDDGGSGDPDGDGLANMHEYQNGTNPRNPDTDGDLLTDLWEVQNDLDPNSGEGDNGAEGDPDGDGLSNLEEAMHGTHPRSNDTDGDRMDDKWEIQNSLDPKSAGGDDGSQGDPDGDGLSNLREYQNMTDPTDSDSDDDGMGDLWEVENGLDPTLSTGDDGADGDPDGDRLTNLEEQAHGTDPTSNDTDSDRMDDGWEVRNNLDPNSAEGDHGSDGDPDGDGLLNLQEYQNATDPNQPDSDDDGMDDLWEVDNGLDPTVASGDDGPDGDPDGDQITNLQEYEYGLDPLTPNTDTDEDGLGDAWEIKYGLSPTSSEGDNGPAGDPDADGLSNADEYQTGTNPVNEDTDADGMNDGWEARNGLDPTSDAGDNGAIGDPDGDSLTNEEEYQHGTNPRNGDTDGDLMGDGWEIQNGLNPSNAEGDDGSEGDPDGDGLMNLEEYENLTNPQVADTDNDGMDDLWEVQNELDPVVDFGDDGPEGDPDSDGSLNIDEMIAGTDPQSSESVFKIVSIRKNPPSIVISWTTVDTRYYRLLVADSLEGTWTVVADGLLGTGDPHDFEDEQGEPNGTRFYKVEVY